MKKEQRPPRISRRNFSPNGRQRTNAGLLSANRCKMRRRSAVPASTWRSGRPRYVTLMFYRPFCRCSYLTPTFSLRRQKPSMTGQSLPISMPTTRHATSPNRVISPTPIQMAGPTTFSPLHRVSVLPHATNVRDSLSGLGLLPFGASVPPLLSALTKKAKKTPSSRVGGRRQRSKRRRMRSSKPKWHKHRPSPNPS